MVGLVWIEADNPLDSGVELPPRVVDWAWRGEAVATAYADHKSLRKVAAMFGLNHEKVRTLVAKYSPSVRTEPMTAETDKRRAEIAHERGLHLDDDADVIDEIIFAEDDQRAGSNSAA